MDTGTVDIRLAAPEDLADVLRVQQEAFGRVADELGIPRDHLPPLRESLDDLIHLHTTGTLFLVAHMDGEIVGSVRGAQEGDEVSVGRLVVGNGWIRRGVASAMMPELESRFPDAARFTLFTGADAVAPLALYRKLGYSVIRSTDQEGVPLVWLSKATGSDCDVMYAESHD